MVGSNCEDTLYLLEDTRRRCQPGMSQDINLYEIYTLTFTLQVFSPAKVIFVGVGVLLSVCIRLDTSFGPS